MLVIGLDILFSKRMLAWDGIEVEMMNRKIIIENMNDVEELRTIEPKVILDVKYIKPDLTKK